MSGITINVQHVHFQPIQQRGEPTKAENNYGRFGQDAKIAEAKAFVKQLQEEFNGHHMVRVDDVHTRLCRLEGILNG